MPAEWDEYLRRMGRIREVGAGGAGDIPLGSLSWSEVDEARNDKRMARARDPETGTEMEPKNFQAASKRPARAGDLDANANAACHKIAESATTTRPPEHVARAFPERARQFMPFSALKGFDELIAAEERRAAEREAASEKYSHHDRFYPA